VVECHAELIGVRRSQLREIVIHRIGPGVRWSLVAGTGLTKRRALTGRC